MDQTDDCGVVVEEETMIASSKSRPDQPALDKIGLLSDWTAVDKTDRDTDHSSDIDEVDVSTAEVNALDSTPNTGNQDEQTDVDPVTEDAIVAGAKVSARTNLLDDKLFGKLAATVQPTNKDVITASETSVVTHAAPRTTPSTDPNEVDRAVVAPTRKTLKEGWVGQAARSDEFSWLTAEHADERRASVDSLVFEDELITAETSTHVESAPPLPAIREDEVRADKKASARFDVDFSGLLAEPKAGRVTSKQATVQSQPSTEVAEDQIQTTKVSARKFDNFLAQTKIEFTDRSVSDTDDRSSLYEVDGIPESEVIHVTPVEVQFAGPLVEEESIVPQSKRTAFVVPEYPVGLSANLSVEASPKSKKSGGGGVFGFFKRKPKNGGHNITVDDAKIKSNSLDKRTVEKHHEVEIKSGSTLPADGRKQKNGRGRFNIGLNFGFGSKNATGPPATGDHGGTSLKAETPQTSTAGEAAKSPSKTNIRVFEIMADQQNGAGGGAGTGLKEQPATTAALIGPEGPSVTARVPPASIELTKPSSPTTSVSSSVSPSHPQRPPPVVDVHVSAPLPPTVPAFSSQYMVAVAIDFGTAFSGYAFSFTHESSTSSSPTSRSGFSGSGSIHMMGKWEGSDPGIINQKTPSTLLLTPQGQFHSFGFTARNFYHDLTSDEARNWLFFDKFKMCLYESSDCTKDLQIEAANGQRFSASKAVSMTLKFFKDHALRELSNQCGTTIDNDDVRWIITVPAIWNEQAKKFMRLAAYEAGIATSANADQLLIALEPEAASIHIRRLRLRQLVPDKPVRRPLSVRPDNDVDVMGGGQDAQQVSAKFTQRLTKYLVVDCGGGTVDVTVHELDVLNGRLEELHKATGGPHGSCGIDTEFERLLDAIFGADAMKLFRRKRPADWICLQAAFESRKRAANPQSPTPLNIPLPFSFIEFYRKHAGSSIESAVNKFADKGVRWSSQGMLRLTQDAMRRLFQSTVDNIHRIIASVLDNPKLQDVQYIFLVGGLSESPLLQQATREKFGAKAQVLVPQEASLAVLKGAVCFGLDHTVISTRRSRLTYGTGVLKRFIRDQHPESKLLRRDGSEWCRDVFDPYVVVDQVVRLGDVVVRRYAPASPTQSYISVTLYSSTHPAPTFTTDDGVTRCANIRLELSSIDEPQNAGKKKRARSLRVIETRMAFADTELKVSAIDVATGQLVNAAIDFFNA